VCDFGLAQMKPRDVANLEYDPHGSPLYMAPGTPPLLRRPCRRSARGLLVAGRLVVALVGRSV